MYFSRIGFNPDADHQLLARQLCDDSYREHQVLWRLFDGNPDAERDFLYRQVIEHGRMKYYVLSARVPVDRSGLWRIDPPKVYDPQLAAGQRLFFMLRVNPVVTVTMASGRRQRHDVVMQEKQRIGYRKLPAAARPPLQELVQQSGIRWLSERMARNGFSIEPGQVLAEGYQQHRCRTRRRQPFIRYSTVDFQGILTVVNADRFRNALFAGIGRSKAFGCGLLLIKPHHQGQPAHDVD